MTGEFHSFNMGVESFLLSDVMRGKYPHFVSAAYVWYCACRKLNSSLIRSHDSATVNLKGWLG